MPFRQIARSVIHRAKGVGFTLVVGLAMIAWAPAPAFANCSGTLVDGQVAAWGTDFGSWGTRSDVWVNNFDSHQFMAWRGTVVLYNSSNFAEVGWVTKEDIDQKAHPYKTWFNNGIGHTVRFGLLDITPRDDLHTFVVKDPNDDNDYNFIYDNTEFTTTEHVSIDPTLAESLTTSERACTADSLYAKYRELKYIPNTSGGFSYWPNNVEITPVQESPYQYCFVGNHAYNVFQTC